MQHRLSFECREGSADMKILIEIIAEVIFELSNNYLQTQSNILER